VGWGAAAQASGKSYHFGAIAIIVYQPAAKNEKKNCIY